MDEMTDNSVDTSDGIEM